MNARVLLSQRTVLLTAHNALLNIACKRLQLPQVKFNLTVFSLSDSTDAWRGFNDPLAERLNKLIKQGKIPEECLFYKYLNDTASDFH